MISQTSITCSDNAIMKFLIFRYQVMRCWNGMGGHYKTRLTKKFQTSSRNRARNPKLNLSSIEPNGMAFFVLLILFFCQRKGTVMASLTFNFSDRERFADSIKKSHRGKSLISKFWFSSEIEKYRIIYE